MYKNLKYELKDNIAFITVNRPQSLNALNSEVMDELLAAFHAAAADEAVKAVILTGEGKAFVAGADISEMRPLSAHEGKAMMAKGHAVMNCIESVNKPVIAAVNGFALGGGCELAMACDIRIASEKAKFGQPEVNLGIIPGFGGTQRLPRLVGKGMAKYLILTGEMIGAEEALRIGLVERVVPAEELLDTAEKTAKAIMSKGPIAVATAKLAIDVGSDLGLAAANQFELEAVVTPFASEDRLEGMGAFLEKRPPAFKNK